MNKDLAFKLTLILLAAVAVWVVLRRKHDKQEQTVKNGDIGDHIVKCDTVTKPLDEISPGIYSVPPAGDLLVSLIDDKNGLEVDGMISINDLPEGGKNILPIVVGPEPITVQSAPNLGIIATFKVLAPIDRQILLNGPKVNVELPSYCQ